jgi:glycyl-tRNA synthetase
MQEHNLMDKVVALAKRRGFVFPGSEIYGGLANSWDYGPLGVELKNNVKALWWERFVRRRDDMAGLDAALIMNPKVWEASGHLAHFSDPLVECKKCHERFRLDQVGERSCPACGAEGSFTEARQFNLMLKTFLGPAEEKANEVYFRPETAQAIFVNFKQITDTMPRLTLPFGVAQIGKAFRNEITPGNFIFRTREFEQMEIEYFIPEPVREEDWQSFFEYWRKEMASWITDDLGIRAERVHELEIPEGERAHYSKRTIDFAYDYPFGREELYGLAYRTNFDLKNHFAEPPYKNSESGEAFWPHVIEPSFGVDRSVLAVLLDGYAEDGDRVLLKLKPRLAPYRAAVFPLLSNKPELVEKARAIYRELKEEFSVAWDDRGNIGKRYYSQDEIGTPSCVTVDFETLENGTVTVRDRDTTRQERVSASDLRRFIFLARKPQA